eukprot:3135447-Amphidinium_carterae.1
MIIDASCKAATKKTLIIKVGVTIANYRDKDEISEHSTVSDHGIGMEELDPTTFDLRCKPTVELWMRDCLNPCRPWSFRLLAAHQPPEGHPVSALWAWPARLVICKQNCLPEKKNARF